MELVRLSLCLRFDPTSRNEQNQVELVHYVPFLILAVLDVKSERDKVCDSVVGPRANDSRDGPRCFARMVLFESMERLLAPSAVSNSTSMPL